MHACVRACCRAVLRARANVIRHIRSFFDDRGFLEVETPILSVHSTGAMARPFVTESTALVCVCLRACLSYAYVRARIIHACVHHPCVARVYPCVYPCVRVYRLQT